MVVRPRASLLTLVALAVALLALLVPPLAAAKPPLLIDGTEDLPEASPGSEECVASSGRCTLRAAIEVANEQGFAAMEFDPNVFKGAQQSTVTLLSPLEATGTVEIEGAVCVIAGVSEPCAGVDGRAIGAWPTLTLEGDESVVEHLAINSDLTGILVRSGGTGEAGAFILDNKISVGGGGVGAAIETQGTINGSGNVIRGNEIEVGQTAGTGLQIENGPNQIVGNQIATGTSVQPGILLMGSATGNVIGGDEAELENVFSGRGRGAISMTLPETARNEVRRNRGITSGKFIELTRADSAEPNLPDAIAPPTIDPTSQSTIGGTGRPGAVVRLFAMATDSDEGVDGFIGEVEVGAGGTWELTPTTATGTYVAATQTDEGGTSEFSDVSTVTEGSGQEGGDGSADTAAVAAAPQSASTSAAASKPKVAISGAPERKSTSSTAKFRFKVTNVPGARFECRLDGAKWARCSSPKTYKNLRPGKHTFRVRAVASGLTGAATRFEFTVKA